MLPRFLLVLILAFAAVPAHADVHVSGEQILVDGKPFPIRGAGGEQRLDLLKQLGATVVRTYGDPPDAVLEEAQKLGLKVIVGFWLEHPRRGFDYADPAQAGAQLERLAAFVKRYRDHPALLMWGVGNEVEAELDDDSRVWPGIGQAAALVRRLDPEHPVMAVLAEAGGGKVAKLMRAAPAVDVLGINSYGDALPNLPQRVRAQGWKGPIVVTEMGAIGQWQAQRKPWGASIEPSSTEKAALLRGYLQALAPATAGQVLFYWGQKQEVTPTWHSLLLPDGSWTETAEVMAGAWGGKTPGGNSAPRIGRFDMEAGRAVLEVTDPDGDAMAVQWSVMAESTDLRKAGDLETVPATFGQALAASDLAGARVGALPAGHYRLFVTVRDGRGAVATGNLPFMVN
ncbi:MAG: glycoside hydrolase family 2 TIM barrel-domain containing protein [Sphingomonadales bacterium]